MEPASKSGAYVRTLRALRAEGLGIPVQRAFLRTLWGITFVGVGLGFAAVVLVISSVSSTGLPGWSGNGPGFIGIGLACLLAYPQVFGPVHVRNARLGFVLAVLAVILWVAVTFMPVSTPTGTVAEQEAVSFRTQLLAGTLFSILGGAAVVFPTYDLQGRFGRGLMLSALFLLCAIQILLYTLVSNAVSAGLPTGAASSAQDALVAARTLWNRVGGLNAIPLLLYLVAHERLYWGLRRQYAPSLPLMDG